MSKEKTISLLKHIEARNERQKEFFRLINEKDFLALNAVFGTGKTYICIGLACQWLSQGRVDRVIITRPALHLIQDFGYPPGSYEQKGLAFFKQQIRYFEEFLGEQVFKNLIRNGTIDMCPVEIIRGEDFKRSLMIMDESQNGKQDDFELFISRTSPGSKVIIAGDEDQRNHGDNFFARWFRSLEHSNLGKIRFKEEDVLRHRDAYDLVRQTRAIQ